MLGRPSKNQRKANHRYDLKCAKKEIEMAKFHVELSKNAEELTRPKPLTFRKPSHQFLGLLLFTTVAISLTTPCQARGRTTDERKDSSCGADDQKNKTSCGNEVVSERADKPLRFNITHKGVDIADCSYIKDKVKRIAEHLPNSTVMLKRVLSQDDISFKCVKKEEMPSGFNAVYFQTNNSILYPAAEEGKFSGSDEATIHHEMIHADTARRHRTKYCNPGLFSEHQRRRLVKNFDEYRKDLDPHSLYYVTPIWPPSEANRKLFYELVSQDLQSVTNKELERLHKKRMVDQTRLTPTETVAYAKYRKLLEQCLYSQAPIRIEMDEEQIKAYVSKKKALPITLVLADGVVVHKIRLTKGSDGKAHLEAEIKDVVSKHISARQMALNQYEKLKDYQPFAAVAELDAYLRMGMPEDVLQVFYPKLRSHLMREEACCDKGDVRKCY